MAGQLAGNDAYISIQGASGKMGKSLYLTSFHIASQSLYSFKIKKEIKGSDICHVVPVTRSLNSSGSLCGNHK